METKTTKKIFREPTYCILCHKHENSHPNQLFLTTKKIQPIVDSNPPHEIGACKSAQPLHHERRCVN